MTTMLFSTLALGEIVFVCFMAILIYLFVKWIRSKTDKK